MQPTTTPIYGDVFVGKRDVTDEMIDLVDAIKIDGNDLGAVALDHAVLFSRIATLDAEAASEARWAKYRLDKARAELDGAIRKAASMDGAKKPTDDAIKHMLTADEGICKLTEKWLDAERDSGVISANRMAMRDRKDMIAELMRTQRKEFEGYGAEA